MTTLNKVRKTLAEHKVELGEKFKVKEIGVFGSYARKEQKRQSDVDILVDFYETIDLFKFIQLENT